LNLNQADPEKRVAQSSGARHHLPQNSIEAGAVMKITRIELHLIRVPFNMGAAPTAFAGMNSTSVDSLFVRVCTDASVDGWGEGWGHVACPTTSAALTTLVGPAFIGGRHLRPIAIDDLPTWWR
jgi:L-alanine-DL-glutamate epimerase-like enolase superfamily enzyme